MLKDSCKQMKKRKKKIGTEKENKIPEGAIPTDLKALSHVNTYDTLPEYYIDIEFTCRRCKWSDVWEARHQKWYLEVSKSSIHSKPLYCWKCRRVREAEKERVREQVKNRKNKGVT